MAPPESFYRLAAAFDRRKRRLGAALESDRAAAFALVARRRLLERAWAALLLYIVLRVFEAAVRYAFDYSDPHVWMVVALLYAAETIPKLVRDQRRYDWERERLDALASYTTWDDGRADDD